MSTAQADNRFMEFRLGGQQFALPLLTVKEVIPKPEIVQVPNMPIHFEGMINLRGQILGVFNVRKKLSAKPKDAAQREAEVVIVIEQHGVCVGMIVDEVTRVLHAETGSIGPAPLKEDDPAYHFINSVIQNDKELILTLNVGQLLDFEKYKAFAKAA